MMLEEIAQQPEALARTIAEERAKVARLGQSLRARDVDLIVLVARGSSDNAALFGRYLLEMTTGIPLALAPPSVRTLGRPRRGARACGRPAPGPRPAAGARARHRRLAVGRGRGHHPRLGEGAGAAV